MNASTKENRQLCRWRDQRLSSGSIENKFNLARLSLAYLASHKPFHKADYPPPP